MKQDFSKILLIALLVVVLLITVVIWLPLLVLFLLYFAIFVLPNARSIYMFLLTKPGMWFTAKELQDELKMSRSSLKSALKFLADGNPSVILRRVRTECIESLGDEQLEKLDGMNGRIWFMTRHDKIELFEFSAIRRSGGKKRRLLWSVPKRALAPIRI